MKAKHKNIEPSMQQLFDYADGFLEKTDALEMETFLAKEENEYYRIALSGYKQFYGAEKRTELDETVENAYQKLKTKLDNKKEEKPLFLFWEQLKRIFSFGLLMLISSKATFGNNLPKVVLSSTTLLALVVLSSIYFRESTIKSIDTITPNETMLVNNKEDIKQASNNITESKLVSTEKRPQLLEKNINFLESETKIMTVIEKKINPIIKREIASNLKQTTANTIKAIKTRKELEETPSLSDKTQSLALNSTPTLVNLIKPLLVPEGWKNEVPKNWLIIPRKDRKWGGFNLNIGINNLAVPKNHNLIGGISKNYYWNKRLSTQIGVSYNQNKEEIQIATSYTKSLNTTSIDYRNANYNRSQITFDGVNLNFNPISFFRIGIGSSFIFNVYHTKFKDSFKPTSSQIEDGTIYDGSAKKNLDVAINPYLSSQINIGKTGFSLGIRYSLWPRLALKIQDKPSVNFQSDALFNPFEIQIPGRPKLTLSIHYKMFKS